MKLWLNGAIATCRFELQRSFTFQRTSVSLMLALFPPTMLFLLSLGTRVSGDLTGFQDFAKLISVLLISLVCLLSQLLWACLLYTSPSPRDQRGSRMPSSA